MKRAAFLLALAAAACSGAARDMSAGPVIFECNGMMRKIAGISIETDHRAVIRIDGKAGTFAEWSGAYQSFTDWPGGKLTLGADKVSFTGSQREGDKEAKRSLTLDRASGHLSDTIDVGPDGKYVFEATCSPRPTAPDGKTT